MGKTRSTELNKSIIVATIAVVVSVVLFSISVYGSFIDTDASNSTKVIAVEERVDRLEKSITREMGYVKSAVDQNTKTLNILSVKVGQNTYAANRLQRIVEKLDETMEDLNIVLGRIDERLKGVEDK